MLADNNDCKSLIINQALVTSLLFKKDTNEIESKCSVGVAYLYCVGDKM